jgi:hypothetical protein
MKRLRDEREEEEGWRSIADAYKGTKTGLAFWFHPTDHHPPP